MSGTDFVTQIVENLVCSVTGDPVDEDLWVRKGLEEPDRVGESGELSFGQDFDDVPTMLLHVVEDLLVGGVNEVGHRVLWSAEQPNGLRLSCGPPAPLARKMASLQRSDRGGASGPT